MNRSRLQRLIFTTALGLFAAGAMGDGLNAMAQDDSPAGKFAPAGTVFYPNNLVISRSVYDNKASNVTVGEILPPNCMLTLGSCGVSTGAPYNGLYPYVFNNDLYDGSFGITSRIFLDQLTVTGTPINTLAVPVVDGPHPATTDHLATSFSSKSELALNLSTDRQFLTFMGYVAPVDELDVSNSNTPLVIDPTNPDGQTPTYRAVAKVGADGKFTFTETNAYSGNNGRAAVLNNSNGEDVFYTSGNAGNGANPQPDGVILGAGAQLIPDDSSPEISQTPGLPMPVGSFNITQLGKKADKIGKDDNFRGMTIFNNVLYYTKGSGGNGVNTVYFVDTTGTACPKGVGLPVAGATLPTMPLAYNPATLQTSGLPSNMCILAGFPTALAKSANLLAYPFGLFFANANTLYVADEGDGYTGGTDLYTHAAAQTTAGLQKWVFNATTQTWNMVYVLQSNLGLGTPYSVAGYVTGNNPATGLPWAPATDGLRNITGITAEGRAAIWGVTSTVSGNGDLGADPNKVLFVTDVIANTDPTVGAHEQFRDFKDAKAEEVLRGVSFTPGTGGTASLEKMPRSGR
ncbi:MAG TPA: hypothetical protein VGD64_07380 [Acidisarcina sp.]